MYAETIYLHCAIIRDLFRKNPQSPPTVLPDADPENPAAVASEADEGEVPEARPPKPAGRPLQFHRYACGDILCELFPGIAACCDSGGAAGSAKDQERQNAAKRLFIMSTPEQRSDPNAEMNNLLLGPMKCIGTIIIFPWWALHIVLHRGPAAVRMDHRLT